MAIELTGNEVIFYLKLKDKLAPGTISDWITRAEMESVNTEKLERARAMMKIAQQFQDEHPELCQIPD